MTSLLPQLRPPRRPSDPTGASRSSVRQDLATRRPLVLVATLGGAGAAAATLLVCAAVGVTGWFLTDGGAHGDPTDGLRTGALAWLMGHGSGVRVDGVPVTAVPLGITLVCAWSLWRIGLRVGVSISGHGPDAAEIADGQRDVIVPTAVLLLLAGYVLVAVTTVTLVASPQTAPSSPRVVVWSVLLCLLVGAPAVATGAGRAAVWTARVPTTVRAATTIARRVLVVWTLLAALLFAVALVRDFSTAANVTSQLHASAGGVALIVLLSLVLLPNAVAFSSAFLMGPGFTVGTGTLVAPSAVVLGPLPAFPMLAALPEDGPTAVWTAWLIVLAPLVALVSVALVQRWYPTTRWVEGVTRGLAGGVGAGVLLGLPTSLAGGAVGPGRMRDVAPYSFDVLVHAVTSFGIGGALGGLAMTWWQRRSMLVEVTLEE